MEAAETTAEAVPMYGRRAKGSSPTGDHPYAESSLTASGLPKSHPCWRLPTKLRTEHDARMVEKSELRNGLAAFYSSPKASHRGIRCFPAQHGKEADWRTGLKLVPEPPHPNRLVGKRLGYSMPDGGETSVPQKAHFRLAESGHQTKLFQGRGLPVDPETGAGLAQCRRSKEASTESLMTRKRVAHDQPQLRNGLPLATLGDKAYADPTYSSGYWRDAAQSVPKCGVPRRVRGPSPVNLPKLQEVARRLQTDQADVRAMPALPQGAPRYDIRLKLPRKELDDMVAKCLNYDNGEITILRPPSDAAAGLFAVAGVTRGKGDRSDPMNYVRSEFPLCLLRINGEDVAGEPDVQEALKRSPTGDVDIVCGHETGDAGLESD